MRCFWTFFLASIRIFIQICPPSLCSGVKSQALYNGKHSPTLLGLPCELRLQIFEDVLATDLNYVHILLFRDGAIGPIPAAMEICHQIRDELRPAYFANRTLWFENSGELGTGLLLVPWTIPFWKKVHIERIGRRVPHLAGEQWLLEPGLWMLSMIPNLRFVSLDVDLLVHYQPMSTYAGQLQDGIRHIVDQIKWPLRQCWTL